MEPIFLSDFSKPKSTPFSDEPVLYFFPTTVYIFVELLQKRVQPFYLYERAIRYAVKYDSSIILIMDYLGIGYAYLFGGVAISAAIIIFLLEISLQFFDCQKNVYMKILHAALIIVGLILLGLIAQFCIDNGNILIQYGKELDQKNQQILINLSCSDMNCTANIPNNLVISCPEANCPPPQTCATQTPTPKITIEPPKVYKCPWSLAIL